MSDNTLPRRIDDDHLNGWVEKEIIIQVVTTDDGNSVTVTETSDGMCVPEIIGLLTAEAAVYTCRWVKSADPNL